MTRPQIPDGDRTRAPRAWVVAAILATTPACAGRPLPQDPTVDDAAVARGGDVGLGSDAAGDAGAPPCQPPNLPFAMSLCGVIDGRSVSYLPRYAQVLARGVSSVTLEAMGSEGPWLEIWGDAGRWTDSEPRQVGSWLFRPPSSWAREGAWFCGLGGTITYHPGESVDATLNRPAVLPACGSDGGPGSLQADVMGGFDPFADGVGCRIGFKANDSRVVIFTAACPAAGVPLLLDGLRIVNRYEASQTTACIGRGASVTWLPDPASSSSAKQLIVDIRSMSVPETCGPVLTGELFLKVNWNDSD